MHYFNTQCINSDTRAENASDHNKSVNSHANKSSASNVRSGCGSRPITKIIAYLYAHSSGIKNTTTAECRKEGKLKNEVSQVDVSLWVGKVYSDYHAEDNILTCVNTIPDLNNRLLSYQPNAPLYVANYLLTDTNPYLLQLFPLNNEDWIELEYRVVIETCQDLSLISDVLDTIPFYTALSKQYVQTNHTLSLLSSTTQSALAKHFLKKCNSRNEHG